MSDLFAILNVPLDAHIYNRPCPSGGWLVARLVGWLLGCAFVMILRYVSVGLLVSCSVIPFVKHIIFLNYFSEIHSRFV